MQPVLELVGLNCGQVMHDPSVYMEGCVQEEHG